MRIALRLIFGVLALMPPCAANAGAGEPRGKLAADAAPRPHPIKDCTRFNGRVGYYGNPWCTEAEQRAWDLATDRRRIR